MKLTRAAMYVPAMTLWTLLGECGMPREGDECTLSAGTGRIWLHAEPGLDTASGSSDHRKGRKL